MTDERLMEMAPLYALGALDGDDLAEFGRSLGGSHDLQDEVAAYEAVVGRLALAHEPAPPARAHRSRTLGAAGFFPAPASGAIQAPSSSRARSGSTRPVSWLTAVASIAAIVFLVLWGKRDVDYRKAAREAEAQRGKAERLALEVQQAHLQLAAVQEQLGREVAFRELVAHRASRQTNLAGLPAAPNAAARVVWNPATREAVLLAAGLDPAPPGKVYEAWVIASGPPAPAGTFQVDETGTAVFRMPTVDETATPRTFAVTLEPEGGTRAPTGPMVLAGAVS